MLWILNYNKNISIQVRGETRAQLTQKKIELEKKKTKGCHFYRGGTERMPNEVFNLCETEYL